MLRHFIYLVKVKCVVLFFFIFPGFISLAQQLNIPLGKEMLSRVEFFGADSSSHISLQPLTESYFNMTKVEGYAKDSTKYYYKFKKILLSENLITIQKDDFKIIVNPILNFEIGRDFANQKGEEKNKNLTINTRGFQIKGNITNKFSFETSFHENQSIAPLYLDSIVREAQVFPGQGRIKFSPNGRKLDYAFSEGYISYAPMKQLNLQFGHGKHFIGNGFRSILLSDAAFNYPYLRARLNIFKNKIQYAIIYASLQSLERLPKGDSPESTFKRKAMSTHYLSWKPNKFFELGFFESTIWKRYEDGRGALPFNYLQINPLPILNTATYGFSNSNNCSLGANVLLKPANKILVYAQYLVDDIEIKKTAYQVGFKLLNVVQGLNLFVEYNYASAYAYTATEKLQNYTHYNQSLAHPLGTGFNELFFGIDYRIKKVFISGLVSFSNYYSNYSNNPIKSINFGSNVLLSDNGSLNGNNRYISRLSNQNIKVGYLINIKTNFKIYAEYFGRNLKDRSVVQKTTYISAGLSTTIFNNYYDF
jgi:hypothetical protein